MSDRPVQLDPDSIPLWMIIRAGDDHKECPACFAEQQGWQLLFSKADDNPPMWLCLSCLAAEIRVAAARRARERRRT